MTSQFHYNSMDEMYLAILDRIMKVGEPAHPRDINTVELIGEAFTLTNPRKRYISIPERRWSLAYALGELCWHMRGSDSLEEIMWYAKKWKENSVDGCHIVGSSYGASIFRKDLAGKSQWTKTVELLRLDSESRRAVLYLHVSPESEDTSSPDIGCALTLQFLVRNGRVEALGSMRSNDAWLGLPYDIFFFTMLQERLATELGLGLGSYHHYVGSLHLYDRDIASAKKIVASKPICFDEMPQMECIEDIEAFLKAECYSRSVPNTEGADLPTSHYWKDLLAILMKNNKLNIALLMQDGKIFPENLLYKKLAALRAR